MEKTKICQISDEMFELGQEFSKLAKEATTLKNKKVAFDMAVRAYSLVVKSEPKAIADITIAFMEQISSETLRSETWTLYLDWCCSQEMEPVPKSMFFHKMESAGFTTRRKTDGYYVRPPLKLLV